MNVENAFARETKETFNVSQGPRCATCCNFAYNVHNSKQQNYLPPTTIFLLANTSTNLLNLLHRFARLIRVRSLSYVRSYSSASESRWILIDEIWITAISYRKLRPVSRIRRDRYPYTSCYSWCFRCTRFRTDAKRTFSNLAELSSWLDLQLETIASCSRQCSS